MSKGDGAFDYLAIIAARETWGKHPRELLGEPFDMDMLTDAMAAQLIHQERNPFG